MLRKLLGPVAVCALAWLAFTCGGEPETARQPGESSTDGQSGSARRPDDPPTAQREILEALRQTLRDPRHPSDGQGRAWLEEGDNVVQAGRSGRWRITYEAGADGIEVGGYLRLTLPAWWDWSKAHAESPAQPGYTTAECSAEGVELEPRRTNRGLEFVVRGRRLEAGERVLLVYGAGDSGARADRYAERDSRFWIAVDGDGDGHARILPDSPGVDVAPGRADMLVVVWPSTAEPGETISLRLSFLDALGSRGVDFTGAVELLVRPEGLEVPAQVLFTAQDEGVKRIEVTVRESGVYRLVARAEDEAGEFVAQANPMQVEPGIARIRWADLHGHSNLSDGTGTPEDFLAYARDVAGLDAVCLTDHDHWGMLALDEYPELWDQIREQTERFHDPERFVTVLGYEWTSWVHGHRHVLYFDSQGEVLSSIDERYETPAQLWNALRGKDALTFAHHSAGGPIATDWSYPPDPELEPVTEVASVHGASEAPDAPRSIYNPLPGNFVRDALDRGAVLGFIGSNDSHDGHPGLAHLANPRMGGLAAVLSESNTRSGLRSALQQRLCYATNGPRIILRTALDGQRMGSMIAPNPGKSLLYVRAIACAPVATIELVRGGQVVKSLEGKGNWDVEAAFQPEALESGEYLYVRIIQEDGGAAWSSPFFVR